MVSRYRGGLSGGDGRLGSGDFAAVGEFVENSAGRGLPTACMAETGSATVTIPAAKRREIRFIPASIGFHILASFLIRTCAAEKSVRRKVTRIARLLSEHGLKDALVADDGDTDSLAAVFQPGVFVDHAP